MSLIIASLLFTTSFVPSVKPTVSSFKYEGDIAPLNYFDPLKLKLDHRSAVQALCEDTIDYLQPKGGPAHPNSFQSV